MQPSAYLTVAELLNAPLGLSLKNIPFAGSTGPGGVLGAQQYAELKNVIYRASAMADAYTQQVLGATLDTEEKRTDGFLAGIDNNGYLWVHTDYAPVLAVQSFQYGNPAIGGTTWTVPALSDVTIGGARKNKLTLPTWLDRRWGWPYRVQYSYLNGWPNTTLTGSVAAAATSLPVADATGMIAGGKLTIYDEGNSEQVTIAATWTPVQGAASVALAAGTLFAHTPIFLPTTPPNQPYDVGVSALPPDVQQAALLICKYIVEERGATALVMGRTGGVSGTAQPVKQAMEDMPLESQLLLDPYRRVI